MFISDAGAFSGAFSGLGNYNTSNVNVSNLTLEQGVKMDGTSRKCMYAPR